MQQYDAETGEWRDDLQSDPFARPVQQQSAAPFQSAPTAPPLYPGAPGSPYTNWEGQTGTTPTPTPATNAAQPEYAALWQQSGQNPQQFVQALIAKLGLRGRQTDPTAMNTIIRALQAVGVNASLDQRTDQYHKGIMLNGQFVKLLDGSDNWMWGAGGDSSNSNASPMSIDQSYLSPFTRPVPQFGGAPGFSYEDFKSPTGEDVLSDPGYLFRRDQGRKALETSASAKGLLNSGGHLADILQFGDQLGSQEFSNVFNRRLDTYATNRSNAADIYAKNYSSQFLDPFARQLQTFDRQQDIFRQNQDSPFKKLYDLSSLGLNAASA